MRRLVISAWALALSACAGQQSVLDPAGDQAAVLHRLLMLMLVVCGAVFIAVLLFLAAAIWRRRRGDSAEAEPEPDDGGLRLGLGAWTLGATLGVIVLTGASFLVDRALAQDEKTAPVDVRVTGHQWWWRIEYRDPAGQGWVETANELHLPLGRPIRIELRSADVIHSFWIPNLSGKIDMIPGRPNHLTITPRRAGWLRGQCAEFCGLQHAKMSLDVKVEPTEAFNAWLAGQAQPAPAPTGPDTAQGLALVSSGTCAACHRIRGTTAAGRAGPDLTHLASRRSLAASALPMQRGALTGWIVQPQAIKPGAEMPATQLAPKDALAVASYLEGLR